jgi:hypothetical protein
LKSIYCYQKGGGEGDYEQEKFDLGLYLGYLMSSAQMSLRAQEQVVSRLRVVLQTIPTRDKLFAVTLSILLFLRESNNETLYISVVDGSLTYEKFLGFIENLPNEAQAFQIFSELAKDCDYKLFTKERLESTFLAGSK